MFHEIACRFSIAWQWYVRFHQGHEKDENDVKEGRKVENPFTPCKFGKVAWVSSSTVAIVGNVHWQWRRRHGRQQEKVSSGNKYEWSKNYNWCRRLCWKEVSTFRKSRDVRQTDVLVFSICLYVESQKALTWIVLQLSTWCLNVLYGTTYTFCFDESCDDFLSKKLGGE